MRTALAFLAKRFPGTFGRVYDRVQAFLNDVSHYATEAADLAPHRDQARSFLTAKTGEWAKAREVWCDMAGTRSTFIRERAQQLLARENAQRQAAIDMLKGDRGRKAQRRAD